MIIGVSPTFPTKPAIREFFNFDEKLQNNIISSGDACDGEREPECIGRKKEKNNIIFLDGGDMLGQIVAAGATSKIILCSRP